MATQEKPKNNEKAAPLDSSSSPRNRQSLDELQGKRRDQLSKEDEMVRRNKRSLLLRMKNRLRATKR